MATLLPAPITVTDEEGKTGTATHEQFGAIVQPWNDPAINIYLVAGTVDADGKFTSMNGTRSDTGKASPTYLAPTAEEFGYLSAHADWQAGLMRLVEVFRYIESNRNPLLRPAWFPVL
jgi:hypothetical protein